MRYTITHLSPVRSAPAALLAFVVALSATAYAQSPPSDADTAFEKGQWRAEFAAQAALEAWNYNPSHEELFGLTQGVSYGLKDGLALTARQRLFYVSQRRNDSRVLALTAGLRGRVYRRRNASLFLQFDMGISDAAVAAPPGGTRFNYLAIGGFGATLRLNRRLHAIATLDVIHLSNAGIAGHDRNPDIEAIGPSIGLLIALH